MANTVDLKNFIIDFLKSKNCINVRALGNNIHCRCPFHNPRYNDTAFSISWRKEGNPYGCQSCGVSGNLKTLMEHYNTDFKSVPKVDQIKQVKNDYAEFLEFCERDETPPKAVNETPMYQYLRKRSKKNYNVLDVDYIVEAYKLYYCDRGKFSGRVIMPIFMHDRIVGYNNRSVKEIRTKSKNQKNTPWSKYLYGFDQALDRYHIKNKICIVTEGAFDLFQIESIIKGRSYSVMSLMGTTFNEYRAELLSSLYSHVIFYLDDDEPGMNCANKFCFYLKKKIKVGLANTDWMFGDAGSHSKEQIIKAIKETQWVRGR